MPQLHHPGAQLRLVGRQFARAQGVLGAAHGQRQGLDAVARREQLGNAALGVQDAFSLHLGRVGGQHRRDKAARQRVRNRLGRNAGPAQPGQRHVDAAFLRVAGALVNLPATDVVAVLGQVGQVRKIGEGADHADRLVAREVLEQCLERLVGLLVGVAPKGHRQRAHLLDQRIGRHPFLVADHIAQDAAEQPDVLDQRPFVVFRPGRRPGRLAGHQGGARRNGMERVRVFFHGC